MKRLNIGAIIDIAYNIGLIVLALLVVSTSINFIVTGDWWYSIPTSLVGFMVVRSLYMINALFCMQFSGLLKESPSAGVDEEGVE